MGIMVRHKHIHSHMAPRPTHHHLSTQQFQRRHPETVHIQQWQEATPVTSIPHHKNIGPLHKQQPLSPAVPPLLMNIQCTLPPSQPGGPQPEYPLVSRTIPPETLQVTTIRSMLGTMQRNMQIINTRRNTQGDTIGTLGGTLKNTQTSMRTSTPITTRVELRLHDVRARGQAMAVGHTHTFGRSPYQNGALLFRHRRPELLHHHLKKDAGRRPLGHQRQG